MRSRAIAYGLLSAALFGASTPLAKLLLGTTSPWLLAGLLYLGSGLGLLLVRRLMRAAKVSVPRNERWWLAGAIVSGGVVAPVLLMYGLARMPASGASLLLNAEGLFTALIAWFAFKENFDRRILAGMLLIVIGAAVLSWPGEAQFGTVWPVLAIIGACFAWGLDNNLTRRVSLADATFIAMTKGMAAGTVNLIIALALGATSCSRCATSAPRAPRPFSPPHPLPAPPCHWCCCASRSPGSSHWLLPSWRRASGCISPSGTSTGIRTRRSSIPTSTSTMHITTTGMTLPSRAIRMSTGMSR